MELPESLEATLNPRSLGDSVGIMKQLDDASKRVNVYEREIWNAAIEAAALEMIETCWNGRPYAEVIRKLKK